MDRLLPVQGGDAAATQLLEGSRLCGPGSPVPWWHEHAREGTGSEGVKGAHGGRQAGCILDKDHNYIKAKITAINKFIDNCYNIDVDKVQSDDRIDVYKTTTNHEYIYHENIIPAPGRLNVGDII